MGLGAGDLGHEDVAVGEHALGVGVAGVGAGAVRALGRDDGGAVVGLLAGVGGDGDRRFDLCNRQLTCNVRNLVVVGSLANSSGARDDFAFVFADVGLLAVEGDAGQGVGTLEANNGDLGGVGIGRVVLALGRTVIGVGLVVCLDGQRRLFDLQPAVRNLEGHVVVSAGRREVLLRKAHRIARVGVYVRTLGDGITLSRTGNLSLGQRRAFGNGDGIPTNGLFGTVIGLGVRVTSNYYGQAGLANRQRTCSLIDCVVRNFTRAVRDGRIRSEGAVGIGSCVRALCGSVVEGGNGVALEKAFDCHVLVKGLAPARLLATSVGRGLARNRNRERERVVDSDDVAISGHGHRLARIVGVNRKVLALIRGNRSRRVLCADDFLRRHVFSHLGRGALEVVVHRDGSLVQLEVRVVGVRLVEAIVLGRREVRIRANGLRTVINGPVVEDIGPRGSRGGRASRSSGVNLHGLRSRGNRTHVGAVGSHRIADGDLVLLPHGVDVLVRQLLICRNLRGRIVVHVGIPRARPDQEVRGGAALGLGPTLEGVAGTGRCGRVDVHSLVDLDTRVGAIQRTLAFVLGAVVAVPVDVRRGLFLDVLVHSLQANDIVVMPRSLDIGWVDNGLGARLGNPCVALQNREGLARNNRGCGVLKCGAVPRLHHPVVEHHARRSGSGSASAHERVVLVQCGIGRRVAVFAGVIGHANTVCTNDDRAPLGVEVELTRNPRTLGVAVRRRTVAPLVHGVGHVRVLVIRRGDRGVVQHCCARVRMRAGLVRVPTVELVARALAGGNGDLSAIGHAEVHGLGLRAPVKRGVGTRIGVQEHTVLDLAPLGIDRNAALGHGREVILMRA